MRILNKMLLMIGILLVSGSWWQLVQAQHLSREFGVVSKDDFDFQEYEKDPDARAVVIFDIGESKFYTDSGYKLRFIRKRRIKILDKTALDHANVAIEYYTDGYERTESVKNIEAYSYNLENGLLKKTSLDPKDIFIEKEDKNWRLKKFAIPQVKAGSIIEYTYTIESPFLFNLQDWYFQSTIPTLYSEYSVSMIEKYDYVYNFQGAEEFDVFETKEKVLEKISTKIKQIKQMGKDYKFAMKDVVAYKDESFVPSVEDYIMKIDFQLARANTANGIVIEYMTSWPKLNEDLLEHDRFGKYLKHCKGQAKKELEDASLPEYIAAQEKIERLTNHLKSEYAWDERMGRYANKTVKSVASSKKGSATELNLLAVALFREAGLQAYPVLLSTRGHGRINDAYPFITAFNYTIAAVEVNGNTVLIDVTEPFLPYDKIPTRCFNGKGLIVQKKQAYWIGLSNREPALSHFQAFFELNPDAEMAKGRFTKRVAANDAYVIRSRYKNESSALEKSILAYGFESVNGIKTSNYKDLKKPYGVNFNASYPITKLGDRIMFSPFLGFPRSENPLKQPERTHPLHFLVEDVEKYNSVVRIPEGYQIEELPQPINIDNDLAKISFTTKKLGDMVQSEAILVIKKAVYSSEEYQELKDLYDASIQKFNEQIVLEKKVEA
ncbi:MAG: DUF3857 domain-containing protein, partial [Bacteroidota bacterium]